MIVSQAKLLHSDRTSPLHRTTPSQLQVNFIINVYNRSNQSVATRPITNPSQPWRSARTLRILIKQNYTAFQREQLRGHASLRTTFGTRDELLLAPDAETRDEGPRWNERL
jgi:hypothetical protein